MTTQVTLQEAADLLGVHYMTAYRYVRLGMLAADKVDGAWRVPRSALDDLRGGGAGSAGPGALARAGRRRAPWAARLESRLVAGDGCGAWNVVEAALAAGAELDEVYVDIIAPAMVSIGRRWEGGELDVAVEHRATGIAWRLVGRLGPRFLRRGRSRGAVVLGTPVGERHSLPIALLADLLRNAGWMVSDLGADLPSRAFAHAALQAPSLRAVGVSVSTSARLEAAVQVISELRDVVDELPILVGGGAVRDADHAAALGADGWAPDGRALVDLLDRLVLASRPRTPAAVSPSRA